MFRFGVDYYPEHWSPERLSVDAKMMQEAGINTVRMAEFAWSFLEPSPDTFDFAWLDHAIDILQAHGIQTVLGTPTASPPPWVFAMLPDAFRVRISRQTANYGGRCDYCPTNAEFLERCRIIAGAMADHYKDHPAVIGWQVDNEFNRRCFCPNCRRSFQAWLREKYGSLDALNAAWGTIFWSHVYTTWEQIALPENEGTDLHLCGANPGLDLDFHRFSSDMVVRFQQEQVDILREKCPNHFITHNNGFGFDDVNFYDISKALDFISLDYYPRGFHDLKSGSDPSIAAMTYDNTRGFKRKFFWMTEMQGGPSGWRVISAAPRPGEIRLWSYQAIAHGADAMIYFRWRTALFGAEQYWHGVLDHDGRINRRYKEIQAIGAELDQIGDRILGSTVKPRVAIALSYDSRFSFQNQPNHPDFNYMEILGSYYKALHKRNIATDIIEPDSDLEDYQVVIAPALYVVDDKTATNLRQFVEKGGTLLVTSRSGVKNEANAVVDTPLPGLLAEICGVEVAEYDVLPTGTPVAIHLELPGRVLEGQDRQGSMWADVLNPTDATVIARYQDDYYAGEAAATLNQFGKGQAVYLGTLGDQNLHDTVVDWLLQVGSLAAPVNAPTGVEAIERRNGNESFLFLLNHNDTPEQVSLPEPMTDLLTNQSLDGVACLEPRGVMILI